MTSQGLYLEEVLERTSLKKLFLERGKILVMSIGADHYYFENAKDYEFVRGLTEAIEAVNGTVVDVKGHVHADKNYIPPTYVRLPLDSEVMWYEELDTV